MPVVKTLTTNHPLLLSYIFLFFLHQFRVCLGWQPWAGTERRRKDGYPKCWDLQLRNFTATYLKSIEHRGRMRRRRHYNLEKQTNILV